MPLKPRATSYPHSQLFVNIAAGDNVNESLKTDLAAIFVAIEVYANGYPSERDIIGLFPDFDTTRNRLGCTVVQIDRLRVDIDAIVAKLEGGAE